MTKALYDGRCVLCQQTRRIVSALDWLKRVEFVDIQDWETVQARWPQLEYGAAIGEIHVVTHRDQVMSGFQAMRRLLRDLPLGLPLWLVLHLPGMGWLGPKIYRFVARRRYAINRLLGSNLTTCENENCKLPT